MNDDQFDKLFVYMERRFDALERDVAENAKQSALDRLTNAVDTLVKKYDTIETERAFRDDQFERLLAWAEKVSKKTGIPLNI